MNALGKLASIMIKCYVIDGRDENILSVWD